MTGRPGETLVATAADVAAGLAWLVKEGLMPEREGLLVALAYQERDEERGETERIAMPSWCREVGL